MTSLPQLQEYSRVPNVIAFLRVIREGESRQDDKAWTLLFGGGHFEGTQHPNIRVTKGAYTSTAAGAFQFLYRTWVGLQEKYHFPDFGPENQTLGAIALICGRGAIQDVIDGNLKAALPKCGKEWASLPGSPYGQPTITYDRAERVFRQYGGVPWDGIPVLTEVISPGSKPPITPEHSMPIAALIATFGPMIAELIPQVAKLFGSGSEVAQRNTQAAEIVFNTAVKAANAVNVQDAVDRMRADPTVLEAVRQAVVTEPTVMQLLEIGGGIAKARETGLAIQNAEKPYWYNPVFVVSCLLLPLVYWIVGSVLIGGTALDEKDGQFVRFVVRMFGLAFNSETRSGTVNLVIGMVLGGIVGVWFGTSVGSMRKTEMSAGSSTTTQVDMGK